MAQLLPNGRQQFLDANGNPLVGGLVYFYIPNTTTPKDTWQDAAKSALNTNPVVCDARGQATIYGDGDYRQILQDAQGNQIWDKTVSAPVPPYIFDEDSVPNTNVGDIWVNGAGPYRWDALDLKYKPIPWARNAIINGDFRINQRAYASGATTTAAQYTLDRWKVTGTGGITFSTTNGKTTVTIPTGQTLQQVVEGANLPVGDYVLSWEGSAQGRIDGGSYGVSGSVKITLTGGSNSTVEFNTGTLANVQFEPGSVATPFETLPISEQLALCRRYAYSPTYLRETINGEHFGWGQCYNTGNALIYFRFPMRLRTTPSGSIVGQTLFSVNIPGSVTSACAGVVLDNVTPEFGTLRTGNGADLADMKAAILVSNSTTFKQILFDAEL